MADHEVTTTEPASGAPPFRAAPWGVRAGLALLVVLGVAAVVAWSVSNARAVEGSWIWAAPVVGLALVALAALSTGPPRRLHPGVALGLAGVAVAGVAGGVLRPRRKVEAIAPDGLSGTVSLELATWWPGVVVGCTLALAGLVLTLVRPATPSGPDLRARARVVAGTCVLLAGGIVAVAIVWFEAAVGMWVVGRPARHRGRRVPPERSPSDEGATGPAAWWQEAAADEAASVRAFEDLADRLVAVGAPGELIARARDAARDEVRHARTCTRLSRAAGDDGGLDRMAHHLAAPSAGSRAGGAGGRAGAVGGGPPGALRRKVEIVGLAVESLADGMAGERFAATRLRAGAATVADPTAAAWLRAMARDEERHADLGRDIAAWCRQQSPRLAGAALRRVAARLAEETSLPPSQRDADPHVLRRAGLVDQPTAQALWDEVRATVRFAA